MTDANTAFFGFTGAIESGSATRICAALNHAVNNGASSIYLAFGSLGGYTADGIYLYNHIRAMPIPVTIHATGNIASVAVAIFAGAETRYCSKHVLYDITHVRHIDVRGTIKTRWHDELHPKATGAAAVAKLFEAEIGKLLVS